MATVTQSRGTGQGVRAGTLAAASLGFAVIQLDVFVVNAGVKQIGGSLGGGTSARNGWSARTR